MTLCSECFKDKPAGGMKGGVFVCGSCAPEFSVGNSMRTPSQTWRGRRQ